MENQTTAHNGAEGATYANLPTPKSNLVVSTTPYRTTVRRPQIWLATPRKDGESRGRLKDNLLRAS